MKYHLTSKKVLLRLKEWEAITNLCLELQALKYRDSKNKGFKLLQKILSHIRKEKDKNEKIAS